MAGNAARSVFLVGTLVSTLLFLGLTYDFHRQEPKLAKSDQIDERVVAGKRVWHKYNCNDCHTILGFGGYYAPDMTKAYFRLGESNIASIVMHPEKVYRNSFRKMPHLGVSEAEVKDLVAFLRWVGNIENRHWPPQDEKYVRAFRLREVNAQQLEKVDIVMGACGGCHSFENHGRNVAGDLAAIAGRITYDRETLVRFILDPRSVSPGIGMPPQQVSRETATLIADFILSLKVTKEVRQ